MVQCLHGRPVCFVHIVASSRQECVQGAVFRLVKNPMCLCCLRGERPRRAEALSVRVGSRSIHAPSTEYCFARRSVWCLTISVVLLVGMILNISPSCSLGKHKHPVVKSFFFCPFFLLPKRIVFSNGQASHTTHAPLLMCSRERGKKKKETSYSSVSSC